ncbi:oxidoreductase, short chain dehydrogenase/reductase family protein (macronuclear) [Tetrahymena thermophila SB210]|uniref:Oxidoreductase, short chain dehydrogenase/reductase family protein n=1 Tax=Tetrahymena thermophila (strain SB210) TaxID=312017 RepID=W7XLJ4_TETTS|nr:oxidoreductase, short chain dehydrogenase/reductase family protein [Tetrahymena thermophila SB210]EWS76394.1 oxidoreductase, short chain dehydrogenase/reductase family protein [Tetrahymena thermophila SB210]|eukprot:XP_012651178.1 oxidoreductase, short chain dehydrogenase/reductase family protein [Tetrahymena thermophila SB210]
MIKQILEKADEFVIQHKRVVGALAFLYAARLATKSLGSIFGLINRQLIPGFNLIERYGKGSYAAISACTDGIGKGFALELARRGFNLVMFIRNAQKGEALAEEIRNTINKDIDVVIVEVDFQKILNPGTIEAAIEKVKGIDISILVNNVGMYINNPAFELQTNTEIYNIISMNIGAQALLTRGLISQISSRKQKGAIINLSSVTSLTPLAGFILYGASKLFNDYFSRALEEEYKGKLDVISVKPGWVATPMTDKMKKKQLEITPQQCASSVLRQLGRISVTAGHFQHEIATFVQLKTQNKINNVMRRVITNILNKDKSQS